MQPPPKKTTLQKIKFLFLQNKPIHPIPDQHTHGDNLPQNDAKAPDVRLCSEDAISQGLNSHPLERQFPVGQLLVVVVVEHVPGEAEVADLDHFPVVDENIPRSQITMDVFLFSHVFLREYHNWISY